MMKKLLVFMLVLGMTSLASATTIRLADEGTTISAAENDVVRLFVTTDYGLITLDAIATVTGGDVITGATGTADAADYGWDASLSFDALGIGTASAEIGLGNFMGNLDTTVAYFDVLYTGGEQVISIAGGMGMGGSGDLYLNPPDFSAGVVTIIPEPATIALLGLGGLVLLRRRKK